MLRRRYVAVMNIAPAISVTVFISRADPLQNGDETGIDCGGDICGQCPDGSGCLSQNDCGSGQCDDGVCTSCYNNITDGTEIGPDCGGICTRMCPGVHLLH